MDLRKLRYFVGVAEAGGFRRASEVLFIAQPSLSRHIRELEVELNVALFERGKFGTNLTPEGRKLLSESKAILGRIDNLRSSFSDDGRNLRGTVRIGAPSSIAALLFGPLALRLHGIHPDIHVVCSGYSPRLMRMLEADEIDTAVVTRVDSRELGSAWKYDHLVQEQNFLVCRRDCFRRNQPLCMDEVIRLPLVLTPMPNSRRARMQALAREAGIELNVVAEAEALGAHASFVAQGLGFAVFSYSAANIVKASGPLEIVPIRDFWSWRLLVRRVGRELPPALSVVNGMIADLFSEMAASGVFRMKQAA